MIYLRKLIFESTLIKTFYHGTTKDAANKILDGGINFEIERRRDAGDLGWGLYVTPRLSLAKAYGSYVIELKVNTTKFAYIKNPYFLNDFNETKPESHDEELFYNIVFKDNEMGTVVKSARSREDIAKNVTKEFLRKGYQGIETGYDSGGETVIFDSTCIKSIRPKCVLPIRDRRFAH